MLFQLVVYGDDVIAEPMLVPSILNCTRATATLSDAVAVKVTADPPTVELPDGTVNETDGGVVSGVGVIELPPPPPSPPPPNESEMTGWDDGTTCWDDDVADDWAVELGVVVAEPDAGLLTSPGALRRVRVFGPTLPRAGRPLCV